MARSTASLMSASTSPRLARRYTPPLALVPALCACVSATHAHLQAPGLPSHTRARAQAPPTQSYSYHVLWPPRPCLTLVTPVSLSLCLSVSLSLCLSVSLSLCLSVSLSLCLSVSLCFTHARSGTAGVALRVPLLGVRARKEGAPVRRGRRVRATRVVWTLTQATAMRAHLVPVRRATTRTATGHVKKGWMIVA